MPHRLLVVLLAGAILVPGFSHGLGMFLDRLAVPDLHRPTSALMLDRDGRLLRPFTVDEGRWRLPVELDAVDPDYLAMLMAVEDRRFREHAGVDPLALVRAAWQWLSQGHIVSGGSTLSMQLARLLERRETRNLSGKLSQILTALALERRFDKDAILLAYLTLAPYGGNIEGVRAASLAWFGKEPRRLSAAESALLVALPQAPEARRPDRDPDAARRTRDRILERAHDLGLIDRIALTSALREPVPTRRCLFPVHAAHLTWRQHRAHPDLATQRLAIDLDLQSSLERLAEERAHRLGPKVSIAILVVDHRNGDVVASVGSADPFDDGRRGYIDMTRAVRSPGSTLKPLIYGLAFEDGIAHPESLIEDRPTGFSGYVPTNFDREFQGTVTVRRALQLSLNVPAVRLLDAVGPARLVACMRRAGAQPSLPDLSPPGLAIGLGGVGVTLRDLVRIYAALARGGRAVDLHENLIPISGTSGDGLGSIRGRPPVLDERAAWMVGSILRGVPAPLRIQSNGIAFKTGTSYGYRDAWAIGFDGRWVVGVWTGRPDGAPVSGLIGIESAAPVLVDVFARLGERVPLRPAPAGILQVSSSADLPPPLRHVLAGRGDPGEGPAGNAPEIAYPPSGARIDLGLSSGSGRSLALKVRGGRAPFTWFADGSLVARQPYSRELLWTPRGTGYLTLSVVDGQGLSARSTVFLE